MKIKKVEIEAFRNVKNLTIECEKVNTIKGNNMQGKTNILNAISWAICGVDLNGSNELSSFIPHGESLAKVIVEFENLKIERQAIRVSNECEQHIYLNNEEMLLKTAENSILSHFGIMQHSLKDTKSFKLLRFLINPLYWKDVPIKDLRKFVIRSFFNNLDEVKLLESMDLNDKTKNIIKSGIATYGGFEKYCSALDVETKRLKGIKETYETTIKVLTELNDTTHNELLNLRIGDCNKALLEIKQRQAANDEFAKFINQYTQNCFNTSNVSIVLYEKGVGENVWKEVCCPQLFNVNLNCKLGSTAETIYVSTMFVQQLGLQLAIPFLPMLIDEGETLDYKSLQALTDSIDSQLFITKVEFEKQDGIKVC